MQRIRSFVHFNSRAGFELPSVEGGDQRMTLLVGLGVFLLVILIIDLAISGGLQISLSNALVGRSMMVEGLRENAEDFAMQFYNR